MGIIRNMSNFIKVKSTSKQSAVGEDIVLRVTNTTRLIFRPELVKNPHDSRSCVKGTFIFQKKKNTGNWDDYKTFDLSHLKDSDWVQLEIKSAEMFELITKLENYYQIFDKYGIPRGEQDYLVTPSNVKQILIQFLQNPENFQKLQELKIEDLKKLTLISSINSLKNILDIWNKNIKNNDEDFWQLFFTQNSWVISQVFSYPAILFKEKAYIGGKTIDNKEGKIIDFVFKNQFTDNILLIDIKTPITKLLGSEYRSNIYNLSPDLSGSISQILNYKHELYQSFAELTRKGNHNFGVFNPKCMLILGNVSTELSSVTKKQSFELLRTDSKQIDILGYDELFEKIKNLINILER